jgi:hypothetical protein
MPHIYYRSLDDKVAKSAEMIRYERVATKLVS